MRIARILNLGQIFSQNKKKAKNFNGQPKREQLEIEAASPPKVDLSQNPLLATAERMRVPPEMPTELVGLVTGDIHKLQAESNKKGRKERSHEKRGILGVVRGIRARSSTLDL